MNVIVHSVLLSALGAVGLIMPSNVHGVEADGYSGLHTPVKLVPDEDNVWLLMKDLPSRVIPEDEVPKQLVVFPEEAEEEKPMGVDREYLQEQMEANRRLLDLCEQVLKRPAWQRPIRSYQASDNDRYKGSTAFVYRTKIALAFDLACAEDGQLATGWANIIEEMKFSQMLTNSEGGMLDTLIASTLLRLATRHAGWVGQLTNNAGIARGFAVELSIFEEIARPLTTGLTGAYRDELNMISLCRAGGDPLKRMVVEYQATMRKFGSKSNSENPPTTDIPESDSIEVTEENGCRIRRRRS